MLCTVWDYLRDNMACRLPKIHRPRLPLRPAVCFANSATFNVSRYLARILSPIVVNTVKSADGVLILFDVVSLITKTLVDLAIKVAKERLRNDASLMRRHQCLLNILLIFYLFA